MLQFHLLRAILFEICNKFVMKNIIYVSLINVSDYYVGVLATYRVLPVRLQSVLYGLVTQKP